MNSASSIYLDCNATTPVLPLAKDAAVRAMDTLFGNPSSVHTEGLRAKALLNQARAAAARALGVTEEEVIFTSGATEAIQTAVFSALRSRPKVDGMKLLYGATEHKAVPTALKHWSKVLGLALEVVEIPVDATGRLDLASIQKHLPETLLLCTMAVNNETGVIQPLDPIEELILKINPEVLWLVDSVQALGKVKIKFGASCIHYAPFSGHKLYAPKGVGLLYVKKGSPFLPLIVGGGQESGFRSGTENLPGIAAFGAILDQLALFEKAQPSCFLSHDDLLKHRGTLKRELERAFPGLQWNSAFENSVPTTLNFSVPGVSSAELVSAFDATGLRVSAGSACSSGLTQPNAVLIAMGLSIERASSAVRMSFGPCTSLAEIEKACKAISQSAQNLKSLKTSGSSRLLTDLPEEVPCSQTVPWVEPTELLSFLSRSPGCAVLDVREPYEFASTINWVELGFSEQPRNLPFAKVDEFVKTCMEQGQKDQPYLILCRSGGRSDEVVRALRALGFTNVSSLKGGLVGLDFCQGSKSGI